MLIDRLFFDKDFVVSLPVMTNTLDDLYLDGGNVEIMFATCFCSEVDGCGHRIIAVYSKEELDDEGSREVNFEIYLNFYDNDELDNYDEDHYEFATMLVHSKQSFDCTISNGMNFKYNSETEELTLTNVENKSYILPTKEKAGIN